MRWMATHVVSLVLVLSAVPAGVSRALPAFPGAEGFGSDTAGGRASAAGARVIQVTNTNDAGSGSLRAALDATPNAPNEPRIIVFRVGGEIVVQNTLFVRYPYVTIAGQTAPGGGISISRAPNAGNAGAVLAIQTHDVVVRYLRLRAGLLAGDSLQISPPSGWSGDPVYNIVVDHCSLSWGTDENLDIVGPSRDVTVQWSIISEGLAPSGCSNGSGCGNSKGALVSKGWNQPGIASTRNVSFHKNIFAFNNDRNAQLAVEGTADMVNNLVYRSGGNYATLFSDIRATFDQARLNYVANYIRNPFPQGTPYEVSLRPLKDADRAPGLSRPSIFPQHNIGPSRASDLNPATDRNVAVCVFITPDTPSGPGGGSAGACNRDDYIAPSEHTHALPVSRILPDDALYPGEPALPLRVALTAAAGAGASVRVNDSGAMLPARDGVDQCVVNAIDAGTLQPGESDGFIIDPDTQGCGVGVTWANGSAPADGDNDGMPDVWETAYGFDASSGADAGTDADGDGYTNIEEYLNGTFPVHQLVVRSSAANDGGIQESTSENSGIGGGTVNGLDYLKTGDNYQDFQVFSVLSFDTSPLPDTATIQKATLTLTRRLGGHDVGDPFAWPGELVADVRDGHFGSAVTLEGADFQSSATVSSGATIANGPVQATGEFVPAARGAVSRTATTQLRLRFDYEDDDDMSPDVISYWSGEAANDANDPVLTIYYRQ